MTAKNIDVEVLRDYWLKNPEEGQPAIRVRAGRVLQEPLNEETLTRIEEGIIKRHNPEAKAAEEAKKADAARVWVEKAVGKK